MESSALINILILMRVVNSISRTKCLAIEILINSYFQLKFANFLNLDESINTKI